MKIYELIQPSNDIEISGGKSEPEVKQAQEKLGLKFSEEYREYLLKFGTLTFDGHELTGLSEAPWTNVVNVTLKQRELHPHIPKDWYVVEEAHIDDIIMWQSGTGEIYQSSYSSKPLKICDSFEAYLVEISIGSPKK